MPHHATTLHLAVGDGGRVDAVRFGLPSVPVGGRVEEGGVIRRVTGPKIRSHKFGMLCRGELHGMNLV